MKHTLLFIACVLASITMMAQEYFPTGMKWEEVNVDPSMELEYENAHIYEIGADTLIGNVTYKKVLKDNVFSGIFVRESGDKVWLLTKEYPTEFLLYNFDWDDNKEVETEYLKGRNIEGSDYALRKETIPMDKCQDVTINGKTYQYYRDSFIRSQIRGIGKVAELNRYPCLLGYKEMAVISPGMVYFKVHWIQRNGEEIFRSDYAKEWTTEAPGGNETEINKQFTVETEEGVMLTYTVISESEKTCMVGEEYHWPVPTARSNRVLKVRGSQPSGDITIPEVANGYNVIRIEAFAFENSAITSVVIPNSVKTIGVGAFSGCVDMKSVILTNQLSTIEGDTFSGCENLSNIDIPESVISIGDYAFGGCKQLKEVVIPSSVTHFGDYAFSNCTNLKGFNCYAENVPNAESYIFYNTNIKDITLRVPAASVSAYQATEPWKNFKAIVALTPQMAYRPFVEDDKVWKVGSTLIRDNLVKMVEYYYFDGDTIINGKPCKQMMWQRYVSPDYPDYAVVMQLPLQRYVGAWYEEDRKVYEYDTTNNQFKLIYDFSIDANDTLWVDGLYPYVIGPRQTGGIKGFKGVYRDVMFGESNYNTTWLEGIGGIDGPMVRVYYGKEGHAIFLMSCTVGDEVIYLNDEYEDGATPAEARKQRIDFTHTTKIKPKTRTEVKTRSEEEQSLYGEYNDQQLSINLDPINDAYIVNINDESGKVVYEKAINAGSIVGLNIDISTYPEGRYIVTVDNSNESFIGEFKAQTTGIEEVRGKKSEVRGYIYNLQGQRLTSLQKGLNIVNGQKVYVK